MSALLYCNCTVIFFPLALTLISCYYPFSFRASLLWEVSLTFKVAHWLNPSALLEI